MTGMSYLINYFHTNSEKYKLQLFLIHHNDWKKRKRQSSKVKDISGILSYMGSTHNYEAGLNKQTFQTLRVIWYPGLKTL